MFISFFQPSQGFVSSNNNRANNSTNLLNRVKVSNKKSYKNFSKLFFRNFHLTHTDKKPLSKYEDSLIALESEKQRELVIESDKQSELNDVIYAEGNVSVSYKGNILKADNLTYDKLNEIIIANGNIALIIGDQIFRVSHFEYSFALKKVIY